MRHHKKWGAVRVSKALGAAAARRWRGARESSPARAQGPRQIHQLSTEEQVPRSPRGSGNRGQHRGPRQQRHGPRETPARRQPRGSGRAGAGGTLLRPRVQPSAEMQAAPFLRTRQQAALCTSKADCSTKCRSSPAVQTPGICCQACECQCKAAGRGENECQEQFLQSRVVPDAPKHAGYAPAPPVPRLSSPVHGSLWPNKSQFSL